MNIIKSKRGFNYAVDEQRRNIMILPSIMAKLLRNLEFSVFLSSFVISK
jgi:hypothetical protein